MAPTATCAKPPPMRDQPYLPEDYADRLEQELDSCLLPRPLTRWEVVRLTLCAGAAAVAVGVILGAPFLS